jgi:hypothetical protein
MMGVELYWDNDKQTIMLLEFEGQWTWDQLFEKLRMAQKVGAQSPHEIGAIVNIRDGLGIPGGTLFKPANFENAKKMLTMGEEGTGPIVIAGANPMLRAAYDTMSRLNNRATANIHFTRTLDEARAYLSQRLEGQVVIS